MKIPRASPPRDSYLMGITHGSLWNARTGTTVAINIRHTLGANPGGPTMPALNYRRLKRLEGSVLWRWLFL